MQTYKSNYQSQRFHFQQHRQLQGIYDLFRISFAERSHLQSQNGVFKTDIVFTISHQINFSIDQFRLRIYLPIW